MLGFDPYPSYISKTLDFQTLKIKKRNPPRCRPAINPHDSEVGLSKTLKPINNGGSTSRTICSEHAHPASLVLVLYSYREAPSTRCHFVRFLLFNIYRYGDRKTVRGTEPRDAESEPESSAREDEPEASPSPITASQPQESRTLSMIRKRT